MNRHTPSSGVSVVSAPPPDPVVEADTSSVDWDIPSEVDVVDVTPVPVEDTVTVASSPTI